MVPVCAVDVGTI